MILLRAARSSIGTLSTTVSTPSSRSCSRFLHQTPSSQQSSGSGDSMPDPVPDGPFVFKKLGLLGGGKMAEAVIEGCLLEKLLEPEKVYVYDTSKPRLEYLKKTFGVHASSSAAAICKNTDLIIVAVKPQNLSQKFWGHLRENLTPNSVLLSIVAGVTMDDFQKNTGCTRIIRTMPNTPAMIQKGMTVWTASDAVSKPQRDSVAKFLQSLGEQHFVHEEVYLDMATAVSGSGPGYVLLILEALIDAAVHLGFPREHASKLVLQTVYGTTALAIRTGTHPAVLRNTVTSPGGTTASALYVLEQGKFRTVLADSLWSAYRRSLELGNADSNVGPGRTHTKKRR